MTPPDGSLHALLVHEQALRGLARGLLADVHAAEDLAQDTWVAALSSGAAPETPRAWLASVARNLAAKLRRGEERRTRRERDSARNEREPSAEEILGREAARARVVAAVLALEEPYRATVLLRHFEDQPPRAIARRHGVPVETVRTRLKRAHELLRARLERELGSERGALGLLLLPLARGPSGLRALPPVLALTAMSTTLKLALAAAAACVLVLLAARRSGSPGLAGEPFEPVRATAELRAAPAEPAPLAAPPAQRSEASPPAPAASPAASVSAALGSLRVTITWSDGTPAEGVHALVEPAWSSGGPSFRARPAMTDRDGTFVLSELPLGPAHVQLDRSHGGSATIEAGEETTLAFRLERGFDVAGVIVDPRGSPVGGAEVWLSYRHTLDEGLVVARTGADGRFRLRDCTGGTIHARAPRFAPSLVQGLRANPDSALELELVLMGPGGELTGRVLDAEGVPVASAYVLVEPLGFRRLVTAVPLGGTREVSGTSAPSQDARTDAAGGFTVAGLEPGLRKVAVQASGHAPWRGEAEVFEHGTSTLEVRLQPGTTVVGRVVDAQGAAVRAEVSTALVLGPLQPFWNATSTDSEGRFRLADLAPGELELFAEARQGRARATLHGAPGQTLAWNPVLARGGVIRGQLVDEHGVGVAEHIVHVEDAPPHADEPCDQTWGGRTDAEGHFAIEGPGAHAHRVEAHALGAMLFPLAVAEGVHPDREPLRLQIEPERRPSVFLAGLVVDASGAPVANAEVRARTPGSRRVGRVLSDAEGGFELGPFPPGEWSLEVRVPSGAFELPPTTLGPRTLAAGETWDCGELRLPGPN